ncbi:hypothetical protein [Deinococcus sonorensis]|uniref:ATPase n=2 Tax=Deinococcus sonorensis TaxID=309891 RepID=A0AAU7UG38_9DEIO
MNDVKNALASLRAARQSEQPLDPTPPVPEPSEAPLSAGKGQPTIQEDVAPRGEVKTLAGRVPLSLHRELTRALLDAADQLKLTRINVDEALEAAMRVVLRDQDSQERWLEELRAVRRERRSG